MMALTYASKGWPVFPCGAHKRPLTEHGYQDATVDQGQIKSWWQEHPNACIGVATGPALGAFVLDVDLPDGPASLAALEEKHGPLPATVEQRTGSGGRQLFFRWVDGVKNSASKIGVGLDIRGDGGYVLVPPSRNEKGPYEWVSPKGTTIADAPQWLLDMVLSKPSAPQNRVSTGQTTPYGQKALIEEIAALMCAQNGSRNESLNRCAFNLGQLISGGELDEGQAIGMMRATATQIGLSDREIDRTIASGLSKGKDKPRVSGDKLTRLTELTGLTGVTSTHGSHADSQILTENSQQTHRKLTGNSQRYPGNLSAAVREWVDNSAGYFLPRDVYADLSLTAAQDKDIVRRELKNLTQEQKVCRDAASGRYSRIDDSLALDDWDAIPEPEVDIGLPLGLDKIVSISPCNVILLEGCTNAGKTALCTALLHANLHRQDLLYLYSEGSFDEVLLRCKRLTGGDLAPWRASLKTAKKPFAQWDAIKSRNPDGITVVDYLEEPDFTLVGQKVSAFEAALGRGVAIVCLQKKTGAEYGIGGEMIRFRPRLSLTLDLIHKDEGFIISALKIEKCKKGKDPSRNPDGKEVHFAITHGCELHQLTPWHYCAKDKRKAKVSEYIMEMKARLGMRTGHNRRWQDGND